MSTHNFHLRKSLSTFLSSEMRKVNPDIYPYTEIAYLFLFTLPDRFINGVANLKHIVTADMYRFLLIISLTKSVGTRCLQIIAGI